MRSAQVLTLVTGMALAAAPARAQMPGHQMPAQPGGAAAPSPELVAACVDAQQQVAAVAAQINGRLEDARQTNSPQEMRAALADLQAALVEIRTRAARCSPLAAAGEAGGGLTDMDHSKMPMTAPAATPASKPGGTTAAPGAAKPADPMAGTDHSKMAMGGAATATKPKAGTKPAQPMGGMDHSKMPMAGATKPKAGTRAAEPMAGMDHSKMSKPAARPNAGAAPPASTPEAKLPVSMAERVADPNCPDNVGRADAPRATYQRKVYYFCSTGDRDAFRKDPAGYLKRRPR